MFKLNSRRSGDRSNDISALNAAIDILDAAKDTIELLPVKGVFGSASLVIALVRVSQDPNDLYWALFLSDE